MTVKTTNKNARPKLEKKDLQTKHHFLMIYMKCFPKFTNTTQPLKTLVKDLIKSNFQYLTSDEVASLDSCFACGSAIMIMAFSSDAKKLHCVGAILFSADTEGIWVNWLVASKSNYDQQTFGKSASNEPF